MGEMNKMPDAGIISWWRGEISTEALLMQKRTILSRTLLVFTLLMLICAGIFVPRVETAKARPLAVCPGGVIVGWTFNNTTSASTGSGTFTNGSGITQIMPFPAGNPDLAVAYNSWTTSLTIDPNDYVEISVDTSVNSDINISFDYRSTTAGPNTLDLQYSSDGSSFTSFTIISLTRDSAFHNLSYDLTSITAINNNPATKFRLYGYGAGGGNLRLDNLMVSEICPTPTPTETLTPSLTYTPSETFTPSQTFTPTQTATITLTPTITSTATCLPSTTSTPLSIVINEVAWAGTISNADDEWIELYNPPGGVGCIFLDGWVLRAEDGSPYINLTGTIQEGGYFLLERRELAVSNIAADQLYSGALSNSGEKLILDNNNVSARIDTANIDGGSWPAGGGSNYGSMERLMKNNVIVADSPTTWLINTGVVKNGVDSGLPTNGCTPSVNCTTNPRPIYGTPRAKNWAATVTPTASRSPTPTRTPTRAPTAVPVGRPVINEFLPRPGYDWNQDGAVDVFDEFIEVKNLGPVDINLGGWKLDDVANGGSNPYTFQSVTLKPGERLVVYGLESNILLSDGGDTVRLLNTSNKEFDTRTYKVAREEDKSVCRMPDGNGNWYEDCTPTPLFTNSRDGEVPAMPQEGYESPVCDLPDTLPEAFLIAECRGYGANMWRALFWDALGWGGDKYVPANTSKWETYVE